MKYDVIVVGAGLAGISAARYLADKGKSVLIFEQTNRIGGLCKEGHFKGTRFSIYGPHIFHTSNNKVWDFLSRFTNWNFYTHTVKSYCFGKLWNIPIDYDEVGNKEWDRKTIEDALYGDYTKKMWGSWYTILDGSTIKRVSQKGGPKWDNRYFKDKYQAFPANGYDEMFYKMTDHKNISITLTSDFDIKWVDRATTVIYTGRIDKLLDNMDLPFRSMGFEIVLNGNFPWSDKYGVINFPRDFDFIRAHSSKILYQQDTKEDVVVFEYPGRVGAECYPVIYPESKELYSKYFFKLIEKYPNVIPAGRLGRFEHMDMDEAVQSGIDAANQMLRGGKNAEM